MTATALYRVKGSTNDVTTCGYCGRDELRGTVVLAVLDVDGNESGDVVYFGTGCAATAGKRTVKDVRADVKAADEARETEERARRDAEHTALLVARDAWIAANIGPDALDFPRKYGFNSTVAVCMTALKEIGQ